MKLNKKGNSAISLTLKIVLVLILVSIIGVSVNDILRQAQLSPKFSCFDLKLNPPFNIQKACYNDSSGDIEIAVWRNVNNIAVDSLDFSLNSNNLFTEWKCGGICSSCKILEKGETKEYLFDAQTLNISDGDSSISLSYIGCEIQTSQIKKC